MINIDDERGLDNIEWSEDGQLLAVSTSKGYRIFQLGDFFTLGTLDQSHYIEVAQGGVSSRAIHNHTQL